MKYNSFEEELDAFSKLDIPSPETREPLIEGNLAKGLGAAMIAGSIAANQPANADTEKTPGVAITREVSGKPVKQELGLNPHKRDEKQGTIRRKEPKSHRDSKISTDIPGKHIQLPMDSIGEPGSEWYTDAGKRLLDSITEAYAAYGMRASFAQISVDLFIIPKDSISAFCKDPATSQVFNTEYACTVNPRNSLENVSKVIMDNYKHIRTAGDSIMSIPCLDDPSIHFTVFMASHLSHDQRKSILVHELKHCIPLYGYVQKVVSLYARNATALMLKNYNDSMRKGLLDSIQAQVNNRLDSLEAVDPNSTFESTTNIMDMLFNHSAMVPYSGESK